MNMMQSILYVEDDPNSRHVMKLLLSGRLKVPHVVILEESSRYLETLLALDPAPEVILLDIHVQPYSGFQMIEQTRRLPSFVHTPVVALTASVMNEEVQQLREVGFHSVIAKPIDLAAFPDQLQRIIQGEALWNVVE